MTTEDTSTPDASGSSLERGVRAPRKADITRLELLLHDWRRQEANLASHELAVVPGSMRAKKIRDAAALQNTLAYLRACMEVGKRLTPN